MRSVLYQEFDEDNISKHAHDELDAEWPAHLLAMSLALSSHSSTCNPLSNIDLSPLDSSNLHIRYQFPLDNSEIETIKVRSNVVYTRDIDGSTLLE